MHKPLKVIKGICRIYLRIRLTGVDFEPRTLSNGKIAEKATKNTYYKAKQTES